MGRSKLRAALAAEKGIDYQKVKQKALQKKALSEKRKSGKLPPSGAPTGKKLAEDEDEDDEEDWDDYEDEDDGNESDNEDNDQGNALLDDMAEEEDSEDEDEDGEKMDGVRFHRHIPLIPTYL